MSEDIQASGQPERDNRGRFLTRPAGSAPPITSDTARSMVQRRIDKFRQAGARGAKKAAMAIDPTVETVYDAHELLVERAYTEVIDNPKEGVLDWIAQAYGAKPMPHERTAQDTGQATATLTLSADMVALLQAVAGRQVVDAEAVTVEAEDEGGGGG